MSAAVPALDLDLFADTADAAAMLQMNAHPAVRGFTTNPTLLRKSGVVHYESFARHMLAAIPDKPISFEVLAEEPDAIERQAHAIAAWGPHAWVKITLTSRRGQSLLPVIQRLSRSGIPLNVTALFTLRQIAAVVPMLHPGQPAILSIFAGRIADTGRDPQPIFAAARALLARHPRVRLLWASPREVFNAFQAQACGADIITMPPEMIAKLAHLGRDLEDYALETVESFYQDAMTCQPGMPANTLNTPPASDMQRGARYPLLAANLPRP
jgi:transaldolase